MEWILRGVCECAVELGGGSPDRGPGFGQGSAEVLEAAEAGGEAWGSLREDGPDQADAGGLTGGAVDDLGPTAGLAEGPLDEVAARSCARRMSAVSSIDGLCRTCTDPVARQVGAQTYFRGRCSGLVCTAAPEVTRRASCRPPGTGHREYVAKCLTSPTSVIAQAATAIQSSTCPGVRSQPTAAASATDRVATAVMPIGKTVAQRLMS